MRARLVALILGAILVFYFLVIGQRALIMLNDDRPAFLFLGFGVLLLPIVGVWALWREIRIGLASQELAKRLTAEGKMPEESIPFDVCKSDVESNPDDWRAWFRLAVAYGEAGDTRNGRAALRKSWELSR
jgi:cytochrome c-type biogenesis protein CcmH/NrfG